MRLTTFGALQAATLAGTALNVVAKTRPRLLRAMNSGCGCARRTVRQDGNGTTARHFGVAYRLQVVSRLKSSTGRRRCPMLRLQSRHVRPMSLVRERSAASLRILEQLDVSQLFFVARRLVKQLSALSESTRAKSALALARCQGDLASLALIKPPSVQLLNVGFVFGTFRVSMRQEVEALVIVEGIVVDALEAEDAEFVTAAIALLFERRLLVSATQAAAGNTRRQVHANRCVILLSFRLRHLGFQLFVVCRVP